MTPSDHTEASLWRGVTAMLGDGHKTLGSHWSFNLINDPKRLAFVLSRYKFAAKLASKGRSVLELGCSEGIGAPILAESAARYHGVDMDGPAIAAAQKNFSAQGVTFATMDFLDAEIGRFQSVVSLDVIEHIHREHEDLFFETIMRNAADDAICVIGTPNVTSEEYASPMSRAGHVNLYDADRLAQAMGTRFRRVLNFGINDELVHTGFSPMAHYLVCVGCIPR